MTPNVPIQLVLLAMFALCGVASAEKPKTVSKEWEPACEGSSINVTTVAGKIVSIDAFVEHFAEGRSWMCHFKDGKIVSALYRHYTVIRKMKGEDGELTTEQDEDRVEVFHFPDHQLGKMDPALKKDLLKVLAIAMKPSAGKEAAK